MPRPSRALVLGLAALALAACGPDGKHPGANVVLISIDTLRADHLSLYGYPRPTSPFLETLAGETVVFDQFVMNGGFTLPSHMTMMTSLPPTVHRVRPRVNERLPDARVTLAEELRARGYRTAAFVDAGWMRGKYGFSQGFEVYDDEGGRFRTILPKAYRWLEEHHDETFFLFLHSFDVHSQWGGMPYDCPAPYPSRYTEGFEVEFDGCRRGKCASRLFKWIVNETRAGRLTPTDVLSREEVELSKALYDGCINYVDARLAEVFGRLEAHGVLDRTLVVVTSDHGEEFLEHGLLLHSQNGFEELARVPLILRFPRGGPAGLRVESLAAMVDLMPTILDVVDVPVNREAQGRSLLPAVLGDAAVRGETTIWRALRTERWKLLPDQRMLLDLRNDPGELENLWYDRPEVVWRLGKRQHRHMVRDHRLAAALLTGERDALGLVALDEAEQEELRALGYLD